MTEQCMRFAAGVGCCLRLVGIVVEFLLSDEILQGYQSLSKQQLGTSRGEALLALTVGEYEGLIW